MSFTLPKLPYEAKELEPHTSATTLSFHHGKHHQTYVDNLNKLVAGTKLENATLEQVIAEAHATNQKGLFNQSGQHFNHSFFWTSMKPNGGGKPAEGSAIAKAIENDFGSFDKFREEFKAAAATHFGSGWAWLVVDNGKLKVMGTHDADCPLVHNVKPILTIDVWEHAYYLDYQNKRPAFVDAFLDHLVNWDFAEQNYKDVVSKL